MVYLWLIPDSYPQALIGEYQREGTPDRFLFKRGVPVPDDVESPIFKFNATIHELEKFACLANNALVPLIDPKCAAILSEVAPDDIQLIKARVIGNDGVTDQFALLNVRQKVVAIDRQNSNFRYVPGTEQIMSFRKLQYLEGCLGSHGLARDSEYLSHLLVSETVARHLKDAALRGVGLISPEEVCW